MSTCKRTRVIIPAIVIYRSDHVTSRSDHVTNNHVSHVWRREEKAKKTEETVCILFYAVEIIKQ